MRVFHYSCGTRIAQILESEIIRATSAYIEKWELPAVWCTVSELWEPTANKMVQDPQTGEIRVGTMEDTRLLGNGLGRIEIRPDAASYTWHSFRRPSGISCKMYKALEASSIKTGSNPLDWRISFESIPSSLWIGLEMQNPTTREWEAYPIFGE